MRRALSYAVVLVTGLALALVLLWFLQRSMIYFPFGAVPDPASVGLRDTDAVTIATEDEETLRATGPRKRKNRFPGRERPDKNRSF